jgi:hypothetical protein
VTSGDDLDLFLLQERAPHLLAAVTTVAGAEGAQKQGNARLPSASPEGDPTSLSRSSSSAGALSSANAAPDLTRKRMLFEQIQSLRHLHPLDDGLSASACPATSLPTMPDASGAPTAVTAAQPVAGSFLELPPSSAPNSVIISGGSDRSSCGSSRAVSPRGAVAPVATHVSSLVRPSFSFASSNGGLGGGSSTSVTPRSRAVRFSATQRHEVREFDASTDLKGPESGLQLALQQQLQLHHQRTRSGSSPPWTGRSILKTSPMASPPTDVTAEDDAVFAPSAAEPDATASTVATAVQSSPEQHSSVGGGAASTSSVPAPTPTAAATAANSLVALSPPRWPLGPAPSYSALMRRIYDERQRETARLLRVLQRGAVFLKYHSSSAISGGYVAGGAAGGAALAGHAAASASGGANGSGGAGAGGSGGGVAGSAHPNLPAHVAPAPARAGHRFFYVDSPSSPPDPESVAHHQPSELSWCGLVNTSRPEQGVVNLAGQTKKAKRASIFSKHKTRLLADGLRLFPDSFHSPAFHAYNAAMHPPWLCLTLLLTDRSLDLVALTEQQAEEWFFGLQALVPLNPSFKSKPLYRWHRLRLKLQHEAALTGTTVAKLCRRKVQQAREGVHREEEAKRALQQQQQQQQQQALLQQQQQQQQQQEQQTKQPATSQESAAALRS